MATTLAGELALDDLLDGWWPPRETRQAPRYVALGVIGPDQRLARFVHTGIDDDQAARIGAMPAGHVVLGVLIRHPKTLRLDHLSDHPASSGLPDHHP